MFSRTRYQPPTRTRIPVISRCCGPCRMGDGLHGQSNGRQRRLMPVSAREGRIKETKVLVEGMRPHAAFHSSSAIYKYAASSRRKRKKKKKRSKRLL